MADTTKYAPINGGTLITDIKSHFQIFKTKRTVTFAYGFMFAFIAFTIFLAFSPSSNSSSPWFTNIFNIGSGTGTGSTGAFSVSSVPTYDFRGSSSGFVDSVVPTNKTEQVRNSTSLSSPADASGSRNSNSKPPNLDKPSPIVNNNTRKADLPDKVGVLEPNRSTVLIPTPSVAINRTLDTTTPKSSPQLNAGSSDFDNQTHSKELNDKGEILKTNQSTAGTPHSPEKANQTGSSIPNSSPFSEKKNVTAKGENRISEKSVVQNLTSSLVKNQNNGSNSAVSSPQEYENLVKSLLDCDLFDGNWVRDDSYPLYMPGSCSLIDEQFNCFVNGRPDNNYHKMKWKPKGCTPPRLDGRRMLEMLRGKRLVFVGDSLNRNMWESLVCILRNSVKDPTKVYEASGRQRFRTEASYSFVFEEFSCTVEFFASPFLVREWEVKDVNGGSSNKKKETLRLDLIGETADKYKNADILVFNTGHWWTHEKTSLGKDYYQEGSHVYSELNVLEAFRKALTTWGRWIDSHINPSKTVVFFRGYSASHFSGGQWNSGGACDHEIEPIKKERYLTPYPSKMVVLEKVMRGMKTHVSFLNVTRMTDYRKDGHPSIYRKQSYSDVERRSPLKFQDCSHWCLPGVPDAWNEMLYAELLVNQYKQKLQHQHQKAP